jgi:hypothetical protein
MKTYFNEKERISHIMLLCMEQIANDFSESNALTSEEKECLEQIREWLGEFSSSVFARFGEAYRRKVRGTLECNTVRLVSRYGGVKNDCVSYCAKEDIEPCFSFVRDFHCINCDKTDHTKCPIYNMGVAMELEGSCENGCPFKW